ncbi:hypothetical protein [Methanoculleus frigidifontis]|nr:hypothetical protein [Methanoculleus sp. FWC-SCC1]
MSCPTCADLLGAGDETKSGDALGGLRQYLPYAVVAVVVLAGLYLFLRRR